MRTDVEVTSRQVIASCVLLLALGGVLVWISGRFAYGVPIGEKPVEVLVIVLAAMGLVFLLLARRLITCGLDSRAFAILIGAGLILRLGMLATTPMLETDFYRYLWDGAVVTYGVNPFQPVPANVLESGGPLAELGRHSGVVLERVNHPELRTIYPPVAQAFFAVSHLVAPWSVTGWRVVLLAADVATLLLILSFLAKAELPRAYALVYWLNPLVLKEIHNSGHMDVLIAPFVLGALLLAHRGGLKSAMVCLALATGVKVWPVLLLPLVLRAGAQGWRQTLVPVGLYGTMVIVMHIPVVLAGLDSTSGFVAYAGRWEMNNGPSLILISIGRWIEETGWMGLSARVVSSGLCMLILGAGIVWAIWRPIVGPGDLSGRALAIVALLFLVSPTQFPWYAVWFLPLLAIRPHPALLLYSMTLPLYYLRFRYVEWGQTGLFDNFVVWLEHGPVLLLLLAAKWKPEWMSFGCVSLVPSGWSVGGARCVGLESR